MGKTKIEWTRADDGALGYTWNPVRGCSRVSPGCVHCYAERQAARFSGPGQPYEGLVRRAFRFAEDSDGHQKAGEPRWTGVVRLVPEHLADPLRWRRPRRVFVNSMSDLFHESLSDEDIAAVFGVMAAAPQHTFQVLTKRAARMRAWFSWVNKHHLSAYDPSPDVRHWFLTETRGRALYPWPLPNVVLMASVEDQPTADARVSDLLACPAAVHGVSYEPALGPVDWRRWIGGPDADRRCVRCGLPWEEDGEGFSDHDTCPPGFGPSLDWIIVGGESGPGARPFDLAWARSTIAQCREAGVACFVKQLGARPVRAPAQRYAGAPLLDKAISQLTFPLELRDRKGGDPEEWPPDLRVREWPRTGCEAHEGPHDKPGCF